jgi:membrane protease YdiL (CAAX protease family)
LVQTETSLETARSRNDPEAASAALDRLFQGHRPAVPDLNVSAYRSDPGAVEPYGAAALEPAGPRGPPKAAAAPAAPQSEPPKQSLTRSLHVGWLAAAVSLAWTLFFPLITQACGHTPHSDYRGIELLPTWIGAARNLLMGVILAPLSEEPIFRGALMGGIAKLTSRIPRLGDFWIPALGSSTLFALAHETSDPVLMLTRLGSSMILARVFHKEGLPAAIATHAFFNGFLILASLGGMIELGFLTAITLTAFGAAATVWSSLRLHAQKPDRQAGRIAPFKLNALHYLILQAGLLTAFFFLLPNAIWLAGAMAYFVYALWLQARGDNSIRRVKSRISRFFPLWRK